MAADGIDARTDGGAAAAANPGAPVPGERKEGEMASTEIEQLRHNPGDARGGCRLVDAQTARDRVAFLRGLRAIRRFRPDPVPRAVVDDILDVARWSGSAGNRQPWELIVIRDPQTLRALAAVEGGYARQLAGAPLGIVLVMAGEWTEADTYDEGRLSERIMLAAAAHGVGASIGWLLDPGRAAVQALLGIPAGRTVRMSIALGYPADARARRLSAQPEARASLPLAALPLGRKPLAELVHAERYG